MREVIFDLDGTLWDATEIVAKAFKAYLIENYDPNFYIDDKTLKGLFGRTLPEIAGILFPGESAEKQKELIVGCCNRELEYLEVEHGNLYPLVEETLQKLKEEGCRLFVVSNAQAGYIEVFLRTMCLEPYFEGYLSSGDTGKSKACNIRKVIEDYHIENPIYVGDTKGDYQACQEANVPFVFAAYGYGEVENPELQINQLAELPELV